MEFDDIKKFFIASITFLIILYFILLSFRWNIEKKQNKIELQNKKVVIEKQINISNFDLQSNYLKNAIGADGQIKKWNKNIIKVFIPENKYKNTIKSAFFDYQNQLNFLNFAFVQDNNISDIEIIFVNSLEKISYDNHYTAGATESMFDIETGELSKSNIKLLSFNPQTKTNFSLEQIKKIIMHEIGHSIGIVGHSFNKDDIMYSMSNESGNLSSRDISTIKLLYSNKKEITDKQLQGFSSSKLEEALNYTNKFPQKSIAWINLGSIYYDLKMYQQSANAYSQALKIDPNDSNIYFVLAQCYIESKKYNYAIEYLNYAKQKTSKKEDLAKINQFEGYIYMSQNNYKKAFYYLDLSLKEEPYNKQYLHNFLITCLKLNKKEYAKPFLINFLKINPQEINDPNIKKFAKWLKIKT